MSIKRLEVSCPSKPHTSSGLSVRLFHKTGTLGFAVSRQMNDVSTKMSSTASLQGTGKTSHESSVTINSWKRPRFAFTLSSHHVDSSTLTGSCTQRCQLPQALWDLLPLFSSCWSHVNTEQNRGRHFIFSFCFLWLTR